MAASFLTTGSMAEWSVRLPGALSIWLTALLIFFISKPYSGRKPAIIAGLIFLTLGDLFFYGSVNAGEIDPFFMLVTAAQGLCIFHFLQKKAWLSLFVLSYFLTAIAFLTKGLSSLAFQAIGLLAALFYFQEWRRLFSWQHAVGISLLTFILTGYFMLYSVQHDAIPFIANLFKESSQKSANESSLMQIAKSTVEFPLIFLKITLPWCLFLLPFLRKQNRQAFRQNTLAGRKLFAFSAVLLAANIAIYWISPNIRNRYLYIFFPFFALIIAHLIYVLKGEKPLLPGWGATLFLILSGLSSLFFLIFPLVEPLSADVNLPWLKALPIALAIAAATYYMHRKKALTFYLFIIVLALVRIGHNTCLLPHFDLRSKSLTYELAAKKMIDMAYGQPIIYTGDKYAFSPDVSIFGTTLYQADLSTPPLLAYQIPYYYTLHSHNLLTYSDTIQVGIFYLSSTAFAERQGAQIAMRFQDEWMKQELALWRKEKP